MGRRGIVGSGDEMVAECRHGEGSICLFFYLYHGSWAIQKCCGGTEAFSFSSWGVLVGCVRVRTLARYGWLAKEMAGGLQNRSAHPWDNILLCSILFLSRYIELWYAVVLFWLYVGYLSAVTEGASIRH